MARDDNFQYINPTPGEFPIMASTVTLDDSKVITEDVFNVVKECGFNLVSCILGVGALPNSLKNAYAHGIRLFLGNATLNLGDDKSAKTFVNSYRNNPGLGGWNLEDEPTYENLTETNNSINPENGEITYCLRNRFTRIWEVDKAHLIYICLVGATDGRAYGHPYGEFLQAYQDNFGPQLWSYDVYPIRQINYMLHEDRDYANGTVLVNWERFYENFEIFSAKAKETGVPFWAYCQSMEVLVGRTLYMPMGLEQYLRFEAFSALAYGAQGLVYWTYRCRNFGGYDGDGNLVFGTEMNLSAPKSRADKTLPYWHYARRVNGEIRKYQHVFLGCELQKVYHLVNSYGVTSLMSSTLGPINYISAKGEGVLLSHLTNNGKDYYVIVSHDPINSQEIIIHITLNAEVYELTPLQSGGLEPGVMPMNTSGIKRTLIPGGYIIMEWRNPA